MTIYKFTSQEELSYQNPNVELWELGIKALIYIFKNPGIHFLQEHMPVTRKENEVSREHGDDSDTVVASHRGITEGNV